MCTIIPVSLFGYDIKLNHVFRDFSAINNTITNNKTFTNYNANSNINNKIILPLNWLAIFS